MVFANVLLGINQGLCWSTTVIMKIDLVGPARRGLAMGLNEAAGYLAVSLAALASGYLAASLRPAAGAVLPRRRLCPGWPGRSRSSSCARPRATPGTRPTLRNGTAARAPDKPSFAQILFADELEGSALFAASQAGMVNNLNDGMAWGLFPLFFAAAGLRHRRRSACWPRSTPACGGWPSSEPAPSRIGWAASG